MTENKNTESCKDLLRAIQMYDFYIYDLNLYLDTHPHDRRALSKFNEVNWKRKKAVAAYIEKYGPLTADQNLSEENFYWVDDPWPWERSAN